jgi:hypothetical protein
MCSTLLALFDCGCLQELDGEMLVVILPNSLQDKICSWGSSFERQFMSPSTSSPASSVQQARPPKEYQFDDELFEGFDFARINFDGLLAKWQSDLRDLERVPSMS